MRSTAREAGEPSPDRSVPPGTTVPHARRFSFLTGVLLAFAALCIVGGFIVAGESNDDNVESIDLSWSAWQPDNKGPDQGAREIADHVAREYRQRNKEQLVAVTGGPMEIGGLPVNIALRASQADGGDINLLPGNGVLYRMCGLGPNCAIDKGTPSVARHLLLRREAMELALYSFRYLKKDDVENVVVFLPPPAKKKTADGKSAAPADTQATTNAELEPTQAIYFQRDAMRDASDKPLVNRPLRQLLPGDTPNPSNVRTSPNITFVDQLTNQLLFDASVTQANQENSVFLVLDPLRTAPVILGGRTGGAGSTQGGGGGTISGSLSTPLSPTGPGAGAGTGRGK